MDLKTIGTLISFICLLTTASTAQSPDQKINRAVFNRIEYFFNAGQPDSIYALANEGFQAQISNTQLGGILNQLSALGKIKNASIYKFENGIASYKAEFDSETLRIILGVDSNRRYHTLAFQPYKQADSTGQDTEQTKDSIISNVETKSDLDLFVDSVARNYAKQNAAQSLAVAVIHKNKINTFFYGETTKGNQVLPDANTQYEIGSLTKTFTASLLADM
ncbi:MAG: serine hydrolase, partial [Sphingobacterium sp.]